jgi:hypothetical protein
LHKGRYGFTSGGAISRRKWLGGLLFLATLGALLLGGPRRAEAYPWMLKHAYGGCDNCHLDPSGAEVLTSYGRVQGYVLLAMPYGSPPEDAPTGPLWGLVSPPDWLMLSGAVHMAGYLRLGRQGKTAFYPMQTDLYGGFDSDLFLGGGSIGVARVPAGLTHARAAQVTRGQGDELNLLSRTHWVGIRPAAGWVVRAGRINLPFGLRIPEHTMWVREATRTDRESDQQHGVALAYTRDRLRGEVMGILGNYQIRPDRYRERGYAGFLEWLVAEQVGIGVSSRATWALADPISLVRHETTLQAHGIFTRIVLGRPVYVQAEFDGLLRSRHDFGYTGLVQLNVEPIQGLHVIGTNEILDDGQDQGAAPTRGSGKPAWGGWLSVDYYFLPQMSVRLDLIERQTAPGMTFLSQFHMYL